MTQTFSATKINIFAILWPNDNPQSLPTETVMVWTDAWPDGSASGDSMATGINRYLVSHYNEEPIDFEFSYIAALTIAFIEADLP